MIVDNKISDLPYEQQNLLRDKIAEQRLLKAGNMYGSNGDAWVTAARASSMRNNIPLHYIVDTIKAENSQFNPSLRSNSSSAAGLGQFVAGTANELGIDPTDPVQSIGGIGDYLGRIKKHTGYNSFGDLRKAYVMGETGYKKYQQGEHVKGEEYVPAIDKLASQVDSPLSNQNSQLAINRADNNLQPVMSPSMLADKNWTEEPVEFEEFMAHPRRSLEEMQVAERGQQLKAQREQLEHTPYHTIEDIQDIRTI